MFNPQARLQVYGQELSDESYAICKADMLIKGQDADNIKCGNSFSDDGLPDIRADYLISNPPFGVDWTKAEKVVKDEHQTRGHSGRFGPGLPRENDGSLLFLLHMLSKMKPADQGGSRLAIVFNGSPLFTGAAGSGSTACAALLKQRRFVGSEIDPAHYHLANRRCQEVAAGTLKYRPHDRPVEVLSTRSKVVRSQFAEGG